MLEQSDTLDEDEQPLSAEEVSEVLQRLSEKKEAIEGVLKLISDNDGKEISTVDPDARIMHQGGEGRALDACYNVITMVDEKHKLVVDFDVNNNPDEKGVLSKVTDSAKTIMDTPEIAVVADKGFYDGEEIDKCEQNGTTCFISKSEIGRPAPTPEYNHDKFKYDLENDCYICPAGQTLTAKTPRKRKDGRFNRAYANVAACRNCPHKEKCTKAKSGRQVIRNPDQEILDIVDTRMRTDEGRQKMYERKKIVEHPFGTIKAVWGYRQFLCRTHEKTMAEMSLSFLAYNFRRVFNIFQNNKKNMIDVING